MSAQNTFMTAIKASEKGALRLPAQPFDLTELIAIIGRALAEPKRKPVKMEDDTQDGMPLVGRSAAMQEIYRVLARLMQTDLTLMITGESGTGKELVAKALHDYGKRRNGPFVAINMAAIPRDLSNPNCSAMRKVRLPAPRTAPPAGSSRRKAARFSSTKSAICRWTRRRACCGCCSRANIRRWAGARRSAPTCASLRPPTRT